MNQSNTKNIIVGCGAQCKYVLDIFSKTGETVEAILDPIGEKAGQYIDGLPVSLLDRTKTYEQLRESRHFLIIGVSDNFLKKEMFNFFKQAAEFRNAVHPASVTSSSAFLGCSTIVNANAVIQPYAVIGNGVMIHAGTVVEHDCRIADFVNLAPNVTLAGGVTVGEGAIVYSGTIVAPNISIGAGVIIGAGSLVLNDITDNTIAYGSPARVVRKRN